MPEKPEQPPEDDVFDPEVRKRLRASTADQRKIQVDRVRRQNMISRYCLIGNHQDAGLKEMPEKFKVCKFCYCVYTDQQHFPLER